MVIHYCYLLALTGYRPSLLLYHWLSLGKAQGITYTIEI